MKTAITFSRQNDAGSRMSSTQYWENLVLLVVLVLESKGLLQLNLSTTATLGTEESNHCWEVETRVNVWTVCQKSGLCREVALRAGSTVFIISFLLLSVRRRRPTFSCWSSVCLTVGANNAAWLATFSNSWKNRMVVVLIFSPSELSCLQDNSTPKIEVSGKLPTYPSPKPTFCLKWEVGVNVGLRDGYAGRFSET